MEPKLRSGSRIRVEMLYVIAHVQQDFRKELPVSCLLSFLENISTKERDRDVLKPRGCRGALGMPESGYEGERARLKRVTFVSV